tara:strand:- start:79 stop:462 length:384 start_codon:yes stop_codon:yes gene_type:complete
MKENTKISTALKIRRFIAVYLLFSSFNAAYNEISQDGQISKDAAAGLILTIVIAYFLFRNSKNKKKLINKADKNNRDNFNFDTQIEILENVIEVDTMNTSHHSGYNPVKDKEGIFSRLLKGSNNRYG